MTNRIWRGALIIAMLMAVTGYLVWPTPAPQPHTKGPVELSAPTHPPRAVAPPSQPAAIQQLQAVASALRPDLLIEPSSYAPALESEWEDERLATPPSAPAGEVGPVIAGVPVGPSAHHELLDEIWAREDYDSDWAGALEADIYTAVDLPGVTLELAECRSTLCKATVNFAAVSDATAFMRMAGRERLGQISLQELTAYQEGGADGSFTHTYYWAREGHPLPRQRE